MIARIWEHNGMVYVQFSSRCRVQDTCSGEDIYIDERTDYLVYPIMKGMNLCITEVRDADEDK